ncbi:PREDICTED: uncharacterized protein LOC106308461 [Brassica oleracea var. oleracea]|uniref:uncharacterized protein LOC106308461 n=1 Tax=Brassica oleracea var. oleracea TaxID=109376 RepID=UPI0006A6F69A|nr:PREDICTED: uncharacterized protein LOC106308461 [Brassica oleracea var. oleracea]
MPFGLKNAGATYQRLVNKMFADKLGITMEVYIDDMLVKSLHSIDHLRHLQECFETLNKYGMKLNPAKCTFGVSSGESTDKCLPFYDLLRGNKKFIWDEKCEDAFLQLKQYLTTPPVLAKPDVGDVLSLFIAVSQAAVSSVLIKENRGEQNPIFYTSRRMTGPETRYPTLEKMALAVVEAARKLRPSGRLTKWAIELGELDITYKNRTAAKSQVLADFLVKLAPKLEQDLILSSSNWTLHVDGSSTNKGAGAGVQLQSPTRELIRQSFSFGFPASNNEAEYESLIVGLRLAKAIKAKRLSAYCDSQLVASQFSGDYDARNDRMDAYLKIVQSLTSQNSANPAAEFEFFELIKVPSGENVFADALAALGSKLWDQVKRTIPIHRIEKPSIDIPTDQTLVAPVIKPATPDDDGFGPDWRTKFIDYLSKGELPNDKWEARRLKTRSAYYVVLDDELHRWTASNGQAESSNKLIIDGIKKRLDLKKGHWADELDGVLWSHRTTPRGSTKSTPFSLAYGVEAMAPAEVNVSSLRRSKMPQYVELNKEMLPDTLDEIEERRDQALLRIQNYQHQIESYYNKRVRARPLELGDLVMRKVFENTKELNAGKLGARWEGPYKIIKVVKPGVYRLQTSRAEEVTRSRNSMHRRRFYS